MKLLRYRTTFLLGIATLLIFTTCRKPGPPTNASALQFKSIPVPSRVLSIAGEVLAFQALGEAGRTAEVPLSLRQLQFRLGRFERALAYEYNNNGKVLSQQELKVSPEGDIAVTATAGNSYLIYADLGARFRNSYATACSLGRAHIPAQIVPRVCTQIFCTDNIFRASEIKERIPELKQQENVAELNDGPIGGFGSHGNICEQCTGSGGPDGPFLPTRGCFDAVPPDTGSQPQPPPTSPEVVVYTHWDSPTVSDFHQQIFKINSDGSQPVNLSNNENFETSPDVNHRTKKIVFDSSEGGLTTMDLSGNNRTVIPQTFLGGNPKWSRNDESFIVYTNLPSNVNNSLHRVHPDGSDNVEIVKAGDGKVIRTADVVDDNHVVYSEDGGGGIDSDLFIKDMRETSAVVNLTNTPDSSERYPVISHDGKLIAYLVTKSKEFKRVEIHIARLTLPGTITDINVIHLDVPAGRFLRDLDFSNDDAWVYVSSTIVETEGTTNTNQIFSIKVNGTGQVRVTMNSETDLEPSVAPR